MSKKRNGNKKKKEYVRVDVLRGLEEQRRKNEMLSKKEVNENGKESVGGMVKEVNGFYYDMERKRYFPIEMKKERRKESDCVVWKSMNVIELLLRMRRGENGIGNRELLNKLSFEKRVWKRLDSICEGSIHGVYMNDEWIWLGYHGCVVRMNVKSGIRELIRECMGGEMVCVNEGVCVMNKGNESRVYDLKNGKEERYREEVMSGCHVEWDGKEGLMICGRELYMEMGDEKKRIGYPVGYVCSCITKCCICGYRNGMIMEWVKNEWHKIGGMRGCVKRLVYERDCLCSCDVYGNGMISMREGEYWNNMKIECDDIEDICILNDWIICLRKNGNVLYVNENGKVLSEKRMEIKGKWINGSKEKCVIVNEKGSMIWSD